jgi:hypothetical protein
LVSSSFANPGKLLLCQALYTKWGYVNVQFSPFFKSMVFLLH